MMMQLISMLETCSRRSLEWLRRAGARKVYVIDQDIDRIASEGRHNVYITGNGILQETQNFTTLNSFHA